jgi:hypothetical protein
MVTRKTSSVRIACSAAFLVLALALVPVALAGKPAAGGSGGGKKGGGSTGATYTGTLSGPVLVADVNGDGLPNRGDHVTFNVTSNAQYYFVKLDCSQSGVWVYEQTNGFYVGWAWGHDYGLGSMNWASGAADCTALLYSSNADGSNQQTLATTTFHVAA